MAPLVEITPDCAHLPIVEELCASPPHVGGDGAHWSRCCGAGKRSAAVRPISAVGEGGGWCVLSLLLSALSGKLVASGPFPMQPPCPWESRNYFPILKWFLASLSLVAHALGSCTLLCAAAEPPFSVSASFSEDTGYGGHLHLDTAPPQDWHHFCSFLGVTCVKRQQFSTRQLGKAEAHPAARRATALALSSLGDLPSTPSLGSAGKL